MLRHRFEYNITFFSRYTQYMQYIYIYIYIYQTTTFDQYPIRIANNNSTITYPISIWVSLM